MHTLRWVLLLAIVLATGVHAAAPRGIDSLAWLAGDWQGTEDGAMLEEHYSTLSGHTILGTSRMVARGKSVHLEWMLIEQTADGTFLTISLPNKSKTVLFKLVRGQASSWVFETTDRPSIERLSYTRQGADQLFIKLEKTVDGKPWSTTFRLRRQR